MNNNISVDLEAFKSFCPVARGEKKENPCFGCSMKYIDENLSCFHRWLERESNTESKE